MIGALDRPHWSLADDPEVVVRCTRWARLPYPILIRGERGTGKTRLAARMHFLSERRGILVDGSFAHMAEGRAVADLLGHRKGSYTGAYCDRAGLIERADRGTLFLDELGRASLEAQTTMLGFLDHRQITRLGASEEKRLDVRLIAATNAELEGMVSTGAFLADLLDRLGDYRITLAPLRERRGQILPLAHEFLKREAVLIGRAAPPLLAPGLRRALLKAPWPGNIRELVKVCEYLVGNASDEADVQDLPPRFLATLGLTASLSSEPLGVRAQRAIQECGGNKAEAARVVGISRAHLYRVLRAAGSELPRAAEAAVSVTEAA